jgi:hypothetical protein
VLRTLGLGLTLLTLGIGFLGIIFQRQRRALNDYVAGTAVVYSWDARAARLRWIVRNEEALHRGAGSQDLRDQRQEEHLEPHPEQHAEPHPGIASS